MDINEILAELSNWSNKKTDICININDEFRPKYNQLANILNDFLEENNTNLGEDETIQAVLSCFLSAMNAHLEEKDVNYYATIAVLYDCLDIYADNLE